MTTADLSLDALDNQTRQLIDQAREKHARTWTADGWRAEQSLNHPGYWDVWTMDSAGKHRIILARYLTANTAALMCFVSTALPQLCDAVERFAAKSPDTRPAGEDAQPYKDALSDLVMLRAQDDIGCVPAPTKEQWAKAWAEAEELTRNEP